MSKPNPKKWFSSHIAKISFRKVDKWAENFKKYRPYFDTWEEAHQFMLERAKIDLAIAMKAAASAERHLKKVQAMKPPSEALNLEVR